MIGGLALAGRVGLVAVLGVGSLVGCSRGYVPVVAPMPVPSDRQMLAGEPSGFVLGPRPDYEAVRDAAITDADLDALWQREIMVPVDGYSRVWVLNTFEARRGDRSHAALDIMVPRFTAVLAADDCVIGRLSTGPIGGIIVYAYDLTNQFVYYYAHLQRYQPGLAVGDTVAKGAVIGYVGTTGNALPDTPHLHFQVMKRGIGRAWWDGPPINPFQFFVFDGVRR